MYADDLVICCPYSSGLQHMLTMSSDYGIEFDVKFNSTKSHVMIAKTKEDRQSFLSSSFVAKC